MGSRTCGVNVTRRRANVKRLSAKPILTAEQHKYLDAETDPKGRPKKHTKHKCAFCGTGGHRRGSFIETSVAGVGVRI